MTISENELHKIVSTCIDVIWAENTGLKVFPKPLPSKVAIKVKDKITLENMVKNSDYYDSNQYRLRALSFAVSIFESDHAFTKKIVDWCNKHGLTP